MSLNNIKSKYRNKANSICRNRMAWVKNPERCRAAKIYSKKADQFVKNVLKDSHKDTKNHMKLLEQRIKSKEHKNLYPINNHDFDYKTAMKKDFNVFKRGITNDPTLQNLIDSPGKMVPYIKAMISEPYPKRSTRAGSDDIIKEDKGAVYIKNKYNQLNSELPYPSFRKDYPSCRYPTSGEHSSSYFVKSGTCKTKIINEDVCKGRGYTWVKNRVVVPKIAKQMINFVKNKKDKVKKPPTGYCFKPRFSYIDNSAKGIYGKKGLTLSMFSDLMSVSPDKIFNILAGYTVDGSGLLPCIEEFKSNNKDLDNLQTYLLSFVIVIILIYLLFSYL
jgi:hypothetical protein